VETKKKKKIVDNMPAGEKELRQVFEETTRHNVQAVVNYSEDTRKLVKELQTQIEMLQKTVLTQNGLINGFRTQLANIQTTLYAGGTTTIGPTG
jgi:t-SNARE complex subunit (syntaxin)